METLGRRRDSLPPYPEELREALRVSEQPCLDLPNDDSKAHELRGVRKPLRGQIAWTQEVVIEIREHQPAAPPRSRVVARKRAAKIPLAILDLHAMEKRAGMGHDPSEHRLVR
jgi:hypothetical protein